METHHIQRQIIELHVPDEASTHTLRQTMTSSIEQAFAQQFENLVENLVPTGQTVHLQQLTIDLGAFLGSEPPEEIAQRLEAQLATALKSALGQPKNTTETDSTQEHSESQARTLFLHTGQLPWDATHQQPWPQWLAAVARHPDTHTAALTHPSVLQRLLHHLPEAQRWEVWQDQISLPPSLQAALRQALPLHLRQQPPFWQHLLATRQNPNTTPETLRILIRAWLKALPGPWTQQPMPEAITSPLALPAATPWQTLRPTASAANHPARQRQQAWQPWLQQWQAASQKTLTEIAHLKTLLALLQQARTLFQGTPVAHTAADLRVLLQGRLRQRQRQQAGLTPQALQQLSTLLTQATQQIAQSPNQEPHGWHTWQQSLQKHLPGLGNTPTPQEENFLAWAYRTLHPGTNPDNPPQLPAQWQALAQAWQALWQGQITAEPGSHQETQSTKPQTTSSPRREDKTTPAPQQDGQKSAKTEDSTPPTAADRAQEPDTTHTTRATDSEPKPRAARESAYTAWWQAHRTLLEALPTAVQQTLRAWLFPPALLTKQAVSTLAQSLPNTETPALVEAFAKLKSWLQLHQAVPEAEFVQTLQPELHFLAREVQQALADTPATSKPRQTSGPALPESLYINTGGLVILWPFLRPFFRHVGVVTEEDQFVSEAQQARAPMLLWYLASGQTEAIEPDLALCKVLAGWPLEEPMPLQLSPTEAEQTQVAQLLSSALQPSAKLTQSGTDAFRGNFLMREAILQRPAPNWTLQVERKPYDLLLSTLPWQWNLIKLPWLDPLMQVSWGE